MYKKKFLYWPFLFVLVVSFMFFSRKFKPTHIDGPFILWQGEKTLQFTYLSFDTVKTLVHVVPSNNSPVAVNGFLSDQNIVYNINKHYVPENSTVTSSRYICVGNVFGQYNKLTEFLKGNKVINDDFSWTFGKGDLIFAGNIFGYGQEVAKCLWLIYKLQEEAQKAGGHVYLLLGREEIKMLNRNVGSLNSEVYQMMEKFHLDYSILFGDSSVLGMWLKTRNSVIKINDALISGNGISKHILDQHFTLDQLNERVLSHFNKAVEDTLEIVGGTNSLFEYDGYKFNSELSKDEIMNEQAMDELLKFYDARNVIVNNGGGKSVQSYLNNKVYAIDLPVNKTDISLEGLLFEDKKFYRVTQFGERTNI